MNLNRFLISFILLGFFLIGSALNASAADEYSIKVKEGDVFVYEVIKVDEDGLNFVFNDSSWTNSPYGEMGTREKYVITGITENAHSWIINVSYWKSTYGFFGIAPDRTHRIFMDKNPYPGNDIEFLLPFCPTPVSDYLTILGSKNSDQISSAGTIFTFTFNHPPECSLNYIYDASNGVLFTKYLMLEGKIIWQISRTENTEDTFFGYKLSDLLTVIIIISIIAAVIIVTTFLISKRIKSNRELLEKSISSNDSNQEVKLSQENASQENADITYKKKETKIDFFMLFSLILGLSGGLMLIIGGILAIKTMIQIEDILKTYGMAFSDIGIDVSLFYMNFIFTLLWGILALIGALLVLKVNKIGNIILLSAGIIAIAGMFIPLANITIEVYGYTQTIGIISLSSSLIWIDPFLVLLGGIIGLIKNYK